MRRMPAALIGFLAGAVVFAAATALGAAGVGWCGFVVVVVVGTHHVHGARRSGVPASPPRVAPLPPPPYPASPAPAGPVWRYTFRPGDTPYPGADLR